MRVLMTCGGTGGHINPAIAIANTIKNNIPGAEILFVGARRDKEGVLVPREGYEIRFVESQGIRRSLSLSNIKAIYMALVSPYKAKPILKEFAPDVVIGTGGYACWPVLRAASMMGIPCAVHESNARPGMAVKRLQKHVNKILVNFDKTRDELTCKDKVITVGNPLRSAFSHMEKGAAREKLGIPKDAFFVLSYGGSGGAEFLNETIVKVMGLLSKKSCNVILQHAAGNRDYEATKARFAELGLEGSPNFKLEEYIFDMPVRMAAADLVICRAGAMTVSELAMMGKASILIPSPNVTDNHQYLNAKVLADAGAACLLEEAHLTPELVCQNIEHYLVSAEQRERMEALIKDFADPDANRRIFDEIMELAKSNK
ncbi:MAG: undecaprenyldiphospho-muramoylpentapeptide beta-N-acetylglucosaminyltransferase [Clostridia bacterium]|nr:undecaprenyldiphospho-muramoylpentapeptide beta-N-acetylglucosaminyltransferase [Clostridia bacterium]